MSYESIDHLRSQLGAAPAKPENIAYAEKMLHKVPDAPVVDRAEFILGHCRGKRVLEFGASGPMHDKIVAVASVCVGVDREDGPGVIGFDLDDISRDLPDSVMNAEGEAGPDVIICGEVIEHLGNPQWFLTRLKRQYPGVPVVITVPNAFSEAGRKHIEKGTENVNVDHVAWYSFRTLKTLLTRAGYDKLVFGWYGGQPYTSEGLIVLAE